AEDGIRDRNVTGVQTCALPIYLVPLILFEGDVGTGKTALAETIGDALARKAGGKSHVHLLKINTQIRGTGLVGEMTDLIAQAFEIGRASCRERVSVAVAERRGS